MATTLAQESTRANDPAFRQAVEAAFYRLIPDVIGEAVGVQIQEQSGPVLLTAAMVTKRHAWAVSAMTNPQFWIPILAKLLAGEQQIRVIDMPDLPDDGTINARLTRMISDVAGVLAADKV
jgi:hypothetical protein